MPYFEAINEEGIYTVEDGSVTLALRQVSTPNYITSGSRQIALITYNGAANSRPVPAFYCPQNTNGLMCLISTSRSGNTWTFRFVLARDLSWPAFTNLSSIKVAIFDRPRTLSSGAGLEFFDANGDVLFSTHDPIMKPVGIQDETLPTGTYFVVGGRCEKFTDVEYEQLTTNDWRMTRIHSQLGYYCTPTGVVWTSGRYDVETFITSSGGNGTSESWGVEQLGYVIDGRDIS